MKCQSVDECLACVSSYCDSDVTGIPLIINTQNYNYYHKLLECMEADTSKSCYFVSDGCNDDRLPDIQQAINKVSAQGKFVLFGLAPVMLLMGEKRLDELLGDILGMSVRGHLVIVLDHCEKYLEKYLNHDIRLNHRVICLDGDNSVLPVLELADSGDMFINNDYIIGINKLFGYLERISENIITDKKISCVTSLAKKTVLKDTVYHIKTVKNAYSVLENKYAEMAGAGDESYGTAEEWEWLLKQTTKYDTFSACFNDFFGAVGNLSVYFKSSMLYGDERKKWLYWLGLKIFSDNSNRYLRLAVNESHNLSDFIEKLYFKLMDIDYKAENFDEYYIERKELISYLPENQNLVQKYCDALGEKARDAIFYLTDCTLMERAAFMKYLSFEDYAYTKKEIMQAVKNLSVDLSDYLQTFKFDEVATNISNSDDNLMFTDYFEEYKFEKLTNGISESFFSKVEQYAVSRPYNKLRSRSRIITQLKREKVRAYFFDALGVEFMAYIKARCEKYGLVAEMNVCRAELPTLTQFNKEFEQYFAEADIIKVKELDDIKHGGQEVNFQSCDYPIYLFRELEIIDEALKNFKMALDNDDVEKIVIISDHGASRLAVLQDKQSNELIQMEEKGIHGGRCCKTNQEIDLPFITYEEHENEKFAVIANYKRFKGSRRADFEVHGGASLEEVIVPLIVLYKRPNEFAIMFVNSTIELHQREAAAITVYANQPLTSLQMMVKGKLYDGEKFGDNKHIKFVMPEIKRSGKYIAEVYKEGVLVGKLEFRVQKKTATENDLGL